MFTQDCPECLLGCPGRQVQSWHAAKPRPGGCCQLWGRVSYCLPFQESRRPSTGLPKSRSNSCAQGWVCFKSKLTELALVYVITAKYICIAAICWCALLSGTFAIAGGLRGDSWASVCGVFAVLNLFSLGRGSPLCEPRELLMWWCVCCIFQDTQVQYLIIWG